MSVPMYYRLQRVFFHNIIILFVQFNMYLFVRVWHFEFNAHLFFRLFRILSVSILIRNTFEKHFENPIILNVIIRIPEKKYLNNRLNIHVRILYDHYEFHPKSEFRSIRVW